jgi:23S rRNA pseudouridine1911/1915/1917 synthase
MALRILHEDDAIIVVEKPAGLATIPGRAETTSVIEELALQLDLPWTGTADPRLRIVHRLDKDTSGVLLLAKSLAAQRFLSEQFRDNLIQKEYLALVAGKPDQDHGRIEAALAPHPKSAKRMTVVKHGGRPAITEWKIEQSFRAMTLLRVFPKTGKTHQIRVHLAHIGLPLVIDPLYGSKSEAIYLSQLKRNYRPTRDEEERPLIARLTLHAQRLSFEHPNGTRMAIECAPPKDFRATLAQLSKLPRG